MFKLLAVLLSLVAAIVSNSPTQDLIRPIVEYPEDNQILFGEKGTIVNKATFLHARFKVDMSEVINLMNRVKAKLEEMLNIETSTQNQDMKFFLRGGHLLKSDANFSEIEQLYRNRAMDGVFICTVLLDTFNQQTERLKEALLVAPEDNEFRRGTMVHELSRRRRGIVGGIALGVSLWNSYKLHVLESHFQNMTSKYNLLIDSVQLVQNNQLKNVMDTVLIKRFLSLLGHRNYHKIITSVFILLGRIRDSVETVHSIISAGRQRRVSPRLIVGQDLIGLFESIQQKAKELDCKMILKKPSDIYEMESSYGYDKEGQIFAIFIHIPLVEQDEELRLLEYMPFPLKQSFELNATILPRTGSQKYLAVVPIKTKSGSQIDTPPHKYRILSEFALSRCFKIREVFICNGRNTLRTDIENSCIGSLWLKEDYAITENCDMEFSPFREFATKLNSRRWIISVPEPITAVVECGKNMAENIRFKNQTILELPENCKVKSKSYEFSTDLNVKMEFNVRVYSWKYDGNIFGDFSENIGELKSIIQELLSTKSELGLKDLTHLKHYYSYSSSQLSKIWEYLSSLSFFSLFGNASVIFGLIALMFLLCIAFKLGLHRKCFNCLCQSQSPGAIRHPVVIRPPQWSVRPMLYQSNLNPRVESHNAPLPLPFINSVPLATAPVDTRSFTEGSDASLSVDSLFRPDNLTEDIRDYEEENLRRGECNPGPIPRKGLKLKDFVCNYHMPRGSPGHCIGYFSE